jgi:hypothetical protein
MDEIRQIHERARWWLHAGVFLVALLIAWPYFTQAQPYGVLDWATLPFHEAGHFLFAPLGEFWSAAGGTLVQIGLPLGFAVYFVVCRRDLFAGAAALLWMFSQFVQTSVYMADARFMLLPLFGGDEHDWNYLFGKMSLLHRSGAIAAGVRALGQAGLAASLLLMAAWLGRHWRAVSPRPPGP